VTNEINGGRFQLAPSSIRKKTLADSASSGRTCTQYRPASVRSPCVRDYTVTMNRTAQRDRLRQLGLFWERVAMPQWGALSEPTRVEVLRLIAQLLREARAGNSALRSEGPAMSDRIKTQHLARKAILYGRRSTAYQVENNLESQKLQYAMEAHLRALGWNCIEIVDEDLGRSASGTVTRTGFERMISTRWPLLVTPTANGLAYFTYLYERLPFATTAADLEALLPWNVKPLLAASIENCIPMSAQVRDQVSIFASA